MFTSLLVHQLKKVPFFTSCSLPILPQFFKLANCSHIVPCRGIFGSIWVGLGIEVGVRGWRGGKVAAGGTGTEKSRIERPKKSGGYSSKGGERGKRDR